MTIELDDADKQILRECPITIYKQTHSSQSRGEKARSARIKRLWSAGYVRGNVDDVGFTLLITITDRGRIAVGLTPIAAPAAETV